MEDHRLVNTVNELGAEILCYRTHDLTLHFVVIIVRHILNNVGA